jgi:hypothetical protein
MQGRTRHRRALALITSVVAVAVPAFAAAPANASLLGLAGDHCPSAPLSQPFQPWGDSANYEVAPAGDFETSAAGWSLANGASVVAGNESYNVGGAADGSSLSLPSGATATSPAFCVAIQYPTVRMFGKGTLTHSGLLSGLLSGVKVDVLYKVPLLGLPLTLPLGTVSASGDWQPSAVMLNLTSPLSLVNGTASIRLRFTAVGGDFQVDDVYVDPYARFH